MAVALESFSIREYAAKMRSVDSGKCWPFGGDGDGTREGEMGRSLPPISSRKFRWWFDELEAERSVGLKPDGAAEELQLERARAPAEEGSRQMRTPVKAKQRAPKKRSIVELFAVSPQIEAAEDETDDGDEEEGKGGAVEDREREKEVGGEESSGGGDRGGGTDVSVSSPRERKERVKEIEKTRENSWIKYKSKKKKKSNAETCAAKKGKNYRLKASYSRDISQLLHDSVSKKRFRKALTLRDAADVRKNKPSTVKSLLKKQNRKLIQNSKLLFKNQEEVAKVLQVHGILKDRSKASSIKKSSLIVDTQGGNSFKPSRVSEKHVTFSGKDDILGHDKSVSPMELPQLQSLCKIFSDVLAASSATGDLSKGDKLPSPSKGSHMVNECEKDAATSGAEGTAGCDKAQLSDAHSRAVPHEFINPNNRIYPGRDISSLDEAVDLNSVIQSSSNSNCLHFGTSVFSASHLHSGDQQVLNSYGKEGSSSGEGIRSDGRIFGISDSGRSLSTPIESSGSRSEAMSSLTVARNLISQPSRTCSVMSMEANERQPHLALGPRVDVDRCVSEIQPMCRLTRQDLSRSICTLVGSKRSGETGLIMSDQMSTFRDKHSDENFIGLPLNSQGELIKLHSSGRFGLRDLFKEQNTVLGSCRSFPICNLVEPRSTLNHINMTGKFPAASWYMKDGLRSYPEQCDNPASMPVTSGLGIMQLHGFERMEVQNHVSMMDKDQHFHHGPSSTKVSCYGCRESSREACSWNNRENFQAEGNLDHGVQPANQPTMRLMGKNVAVGRRSEECSFDYGEIWTDKEIVTENSPSVGLSDTSLPRQWLQQGCFKQPVSEASRFIQTIGTSSSIYCSPELEPRFDHMHLDCPEQWISRIGLPSTIGDYASKLNPSSHPPPSQTMLNKTLNPTVNSVTHPQNIQHMLLMSTHRKHSQSFSFSTSSTSHPAFLNQNCGNFVESSSAQSSLCCPQWLLNAGQHKKSNKFPFPFCSDPIALCHPCTTSGSKLPLLPSTYPTCIVSSPAYNTSSLHTCGSASLVHSSFIPSYPASKSTFPGNSNFRNKIKDRDGTKCNLMNLKSLDRPDRSNKRPAAKVDGFMRPAKKPHLTIQDSSVPAGPRREQLNDCSSDDARSAEMSALANKIIDAGRPVMRNEKNGLTISSGSSSLNHSVGTTAGPVKLSSGAKHILKPSQNMDKDNSRLIHSTIPFAVGTSSCTAPVAQKSTMIYRF
ncbi:uncharacterized protein LOC108511379 [Phoenix dactylifera]|uniref:Uncharacterized protein LOC108511379 n=1 Tax=Phoenix dactylifera TaxID=42345 RepID=A0A8B7MUD1_PHODC|nr:uncharacterized protein LOC108511379 [Phoenix dactylifera]